jgi:hypothetical protein
MTVMVVGNEQLKAERPKTHGDFFGTVKVYLASSKGPFEVLTAVKKVADLFGWEHLSMQSKKYINGTSVPRMYTSGKMLYNTIQKTKMDHVFDLQRCSEVGHQACDFLKMSCFAFAFFSPNSKSALKCADWLSPFNDGTDVVSFGSQIAKTHERSTRLQSASPVLQRANHHFQVNSCMKLAKAVAAFAASILTCYVLVAGAPLVAPTVAIVIALTASFFQILSYYHQNYWCDTFLSPEYLQVKNKLC